MSDLSALEQRVARTLASGFWFRLAEADAWRQRHCTGDRHCRTHGSNWLGPTYCAEAWAYIAERNEELERLGGMFLW